MFFYWKQHKTDEPLNWWLAARNADKLGQLDYFWFYFSSGHPVICPSDPLLNSISSVFWPLTLERKGKGPRDWKMFQNGWTKITTYSTVHWRTNTRADNNEPAVYGSTAGRWQPLSVWLMYWKEGWMETPAFSWFGTWCWVHLFFISSQTFHNQLFIFPSRRMGWLGTED